MILHEASVGHRWLPRSAHGLLLPCLLRWGCLASAMAERREFLAPEASWSLDGGRVFCWQHDAIYFRNDDKALLVTACHKKRIHWTELLNIGTQVCRQGTELTHC